ncbi:hypothetical protein [Sphaerotilus mobilis]|uniref:Cytochrome P450 n=1 Tax=Sphaerotilus mobilis TaxID=47994 RepID=A0A4Q7LL99_9BURK|nr:hypothetical protein [Sphaerotilus mobilis]RZS54953.1 hypothetical protein EV685_2439 [Sphaerotilus mobilis]
MTRRIPDHRVTDALRRCLEQDDRRPPDWARHGLDQPVLAFTSRAEPETPTFLVRDAALVREVLTDTAGRYSNKPYAELGGGEFMLALDGQAHEQQRHWVTHVLFGGRAAAHLPVQALARLAWDEAAVLALGKERLDAVALARDAAVRFVAHLFGFPSQDLTLLTGLTRYVYDGLVHVILGRHIGVSPKTAWKRDASATARERVQQLILDHAHLQAASSASGASGASGAPRRTTPEDLDRCDVLQRELAQLRADLVAHGAGIAGATFVPLCARLGGAPSSLPGAPLTPDEQAAIVLGLLGGTVGNVQTSVGLIVDRLLDADVDHASALRRSAHALQADTHIAELQALRDATWQVLAEQPPVAFLPRRVVAEGLTLGGVDLPPGANLVLWAGAPEPRPSAAVTPWQTRVFTTRAPHDCIGDHVVMPLLLQLTAGLLRLPGLAREWAEVEGRERRLERRWHFAARSLPLRHLRERHLRQQPLCVVMDVREPIAEHGPALQRLIGCAAPLIEQSLLQSQHIHSAWFVMFNGGRQLALFTTYDGSFDAYIEYFAGRVGPLFDLLFVHIVDAPVKRPIGRYPKEFVGRIRKAHALHAPVAGLVFSACPQLTTAEMAAADAWQRRQLGQGPRQRPLGERPDARDAVERAAHDALLAPAMRELFEPYTLARQAGLRLALLRQSATRVRDALSRHPDTLRDEARCLAEVMADDGGAPPDDGVPADSAELRRRVVELVDRLPLQVEARLAATQGGRGRSTPADPGPPLAHADAQALADRLVERIASWPGLGPADPNGERLRLRHAPDLQRVHGPQCLVLDIRAPQRDHARALVREIALAAPVLARCLRESGLAHFAWFVLLDDDRQLALLAQVDGGLEPLLGLLAREASDLFDRLFDHLADPPPRPVSRHRSAFVSRLRASVSGHEAVGGYFFSAAPALRVTDIQRAEREWRRRLPA